MKSYTLSDVRHALHDAGVRSGDTLLVHSSLFPLGGLLDHARNSTPHQLALTLFDVLGPTGTLVVPTFNFDFCSGLPYDRQRTPSQGMGVLSETVRLWPGSRRSPHAMQSVAAVGRAAGFVTAQDPPSSFGAGGPFERLLALDAKLLLLGAPMQAASLVHLVEERQAVPYRYWKCFTGIYIDQGVRTVRRYQIYVRDLELNPMLELSRVATRLRSADKLSVASLGGGSVQACRAVDFVEIAGAMLQADPYSLLQSPGDGRRTAAA